MAPPVATYTETSEAPKATKTIENPETTDILAEIDAKRPPGMAKLVIPKPPVFTDKHEERDYLKGRLAAGFRIFGKYNFDEGVAGHITLRVRHPIHIKASSVQL